MSFRSLCVLALLSFVSLPAVALDGYITTRKLDARRLPALVELLQQEMTAKNGRFVHVTEAERESVEAALAEMVKVMGERQGVAELGEDEKVALINAQSRANAILTRRDRDRLICTRKAVIGTHRRETTCETYGEQIERKESSRETARMLEQPKTCFERGASGEADFCKLRGSFNAGGSRNP